MSTAKKRAVLPQEPRQAFPLAGKEAKTLACFSKSLVFAEWGSEKGGADAVPPPEKSKALTAQRQDFSSSPARGAESLPRRARHKNNHQDIILSRELRNNASPVERKLWGALLAQSKGCGYKFRRQHPVHPYVADFACLSARVLVEIDGDSHDCQSEYDAKRDCFLKSQGYSVLRISNKDVLENVEGVVETILACVEEKTHGMK